MSNNHNNESVQTYLRLINGEIKNFSPLFFSKHIRKKRIQQLISYFVEEVLQTTPEEAYETLTKATLLTHRLTPLLNYVDDFPELNEDRAVKWLLRHTYPELPDESFEDLVLSMYQEVLDGKRRSFPPNYFHGEIGEQRAILCVKYLCEEILGIQPEEAALKLTPQTFSKYRLKILLNLFYDSPFDLLTTAYPHLTSHHFVET